MNELALIQLEKAKEELRLCAAENKLWGLTLSEADITELVVLRSQALRATGRVEFGGGILPKLMTAFRGSPYVDQQNFVTVLADLQEAFYYFKNESMDRFSDDDLLEFMETVFNGPAAGSTDLLCGISLEELCRWARSDGVINRGEEDLW